MAVHYFSNISYYRLKGYWWEMQDDTISHHFKDDSYFEDVIDLYNFDRHFRLIVFDAIERIEVALRTKLIYHLSLKYGPFWHLNKSLFFNQSHFRQFNDNIYKELRESSEDFIKKHYENHPDEEPESWKALEIVTFGTLSKCYKNLKHQLHEKSIIAKEFGLFNQKYLSSWLFTITLIRNIIAHHSRLWNRDLINKYSWPDNTPAPLLTDVPDQYQRRKIFPILSAIVYMNDIISPGHHLKENFYQLLRKFPNIPLKKMGFPENWKNEPIWKD
jgi:abortive infection bacteriophage resistance protein